MKNFRTHLNRMLRKKMGNQGFSLIELMVVIAMMAALVAVLAPQYLKYVERARVSADESTAAEVLNAVKVAVADPNVTWATTTYTIQWTSGSAISVTASDSGVSTTTLQTELAGTLGATLPAMKSATHKAAADDVYQVTVTVSTSGATIADDWV